MDKKVGRNDPCPCGSGKKYKQCCWSKRLPLSKRKFKATVLSSGTQSQSSHLMERTFGNAVRKSEEKEKPPLAPYPLPEKSQEEEKKSEERE